MYKVLLTGISFTFTHETILVHAASHPIEPVMVGVSDNQNVEDSIIWNRSLE